MYKGSLGLVIIFIIIFWVFIIYYDKNLGASSLIEGDPREHDQEWKRLARGMPLKLLR